MSKIIKEYYEKAGVMPILIDSKLKILSRNSDIEEEFEYWISNKKYMDSVSVEGYTASKLAEISTYLKGEGVFMMLIELREEPEKVKKRLANGFKIK